MSATLLVDADILAYNSCSAAEEDACFDDRYHILWSDIEACKAYFINQLKTLTDQVEKHETLKRTVLCFSSSPNWRYTVWPYYKSNRGETRKPLAYWDVVDWALETYDCLKIPTLEADDVLGILATAGKIKNPIIWSKDKDLKQIPGKHLIEGKIKIITEKEGNDFHIYQILAGDTADGYGGCPGFGDEAAKKFVDNPTISTSYEHILKSGKRKGQTEIRWKDDPTEDIWAGIVSKYEKAELTEEDALVTARISKILQAKDYDKKKGKVLLWKPKKPE